MKKNFADFIETKKNIYGRKFSTKSLEKKFIPYFESGERIKVDFGYGTVKTGTVGITTGWAPVFLLMLRKDSSGSPWTLSSKDKIVKVIK